MLAFFNPVLFLFSFFFFIFLFSLFSKFYFILKDLLLDTIPPILDAVFEPTLSMISKDMSEFPEHRVAFFRLIGSINEFCFPGEY